MFVSTFVEVWQLFKSLFFNEENHATRQLRMKEYFVDQERSYNDGPSSMLLYVLCLSSVLGQSLSSLSPPVARVAQGKLKGRWFTTREGRSVAGFLGVPYAAPPVGPLRFKSPKPPSCWEGEYPAIKDSPGCIQDLSPPRLPGFAPDTISEDCLYLNVFTPNVTSCEKYPVMIFIYGGAFGIGTILSSYYGPDYFLDEDIILVTINYRLGILGFLSLEHPVLPGNLGLKDQRAAFRWVQNNIAQFGGDPKKVTIFGQSSGAMSVHLHLIFTADEGLFRAGIADSGSARSLINIQAPNPQEEMVEKLIKMTKCPRDPVRLVDCLRTFPANKFNDFFKALQKKIAAVNLAVPFCPVVEVDCSQDPVITTNPWNTTISIPVLQGGNEMEALVKTVDFEVDKTDKKFMDLDRYYKSILPPYMFFKNTAKNPTAVADILRKFYFGGDKIDRKHYTNFSDMISDDLFNYGLVVTARNNKEKTYFYQLNYRGSNTQVRYSGSKEYYGVAHGDDLFYLFPFGGPGIRNITESDTIFSKQMVKMWANFVKYLDPTPLGCPTKWEPVSSPSIEFLNMGQHNLTMDSNFLKRRMDFWDQLPFRNKQQKGRPRCNY